MTAYRAYGRVIGSDRPLPELDAVATSAVPDFIVRWSGRVSIPANVHWTTLWRFSTGEPWVTSSGRAGVRCLRFGRYLDCVLSQGRIDVVPRGYGSDATLRHLVLDQALPLALASEGSLVVHASAVADGTRAILLAGKAGTGKSTLAALLAHDGRHVVADDGVVLERDGSGIRVVPSYPGLRVYRDSAAIAGLVDDSARPVAEYTRKLRVGPAAFSAAAAEPRTLAAIYVLVPGHTPLSLVKLSRRDTVIELLSHTYRTELSDRPALAAQLDAVVDLAPPMWRLSYPRDLARATDVADAIVAHAGAFHAETDAARD